MSAAPPKKRNRKPAVQRDPVVAALIAKLPGVQGQFTRGQRVNWLRQMAMAMDGAYGVEAPIVIDAEPQITVSGKAATMVERPAAPPAPVFAAPEDDEIRYYVDAKGFARMDPGGKRIKPTDVPNGADIEDEREGEDDLDKIKWADGEWPPAAYPEKSFNVLKVRG